jgi:hypothetical protein
MKGVLDEFCNAVQSGAPEYQYETNHAPRAKSDNGSEKRSKSVDSKEKAGGGLFNGFFS